MWLISNLFISIKFLLLEFLFLFGSRVYPMGSIVIALVGPLVCPSIGFPLNISETAHLSFPKLCMKLGDNKVKKSDTAAILKKKS